MRRNALVETVPERNSSANDDSRRQNTDVSNLEKVFYPQTGFTKGLQNFVPLNSRVTYEKTKAFAHDVAETLEREFPEVVVSKMQKHFRGGKVLVD